MRPVASAASTKARPSVRRSLLVLLLAGLVALAGSQGATAASSWGFANSDNCNDGYDAVYSYLGPCNGNDPAWDEGYDGSSASAGAAFRDLIGNIDVFGGPTPIGAHAVVQRFFLDWDAAGTDTWSGTTSLGCTTPTNLSIGGKSLTAVINAARRARQDDGAQVLISLTQDDNNGASGLQSGSYPTNAFVGKTPVAPTDYSPYSGTPSPLNEYCAVYELISALNYFGVNAYNIEALNEPENTGETAGYAASDWYWANVAANQFTSNRPSIFAGTFRSGGLNDSWDANYMRTYMQNLYSDGVSPPYWAFHDYDDIAGQNQNFPEIAHFKWELGGESGVQPWRFSTSNVWITETGLNNYSPYTSVNVCDTATQQAQARTWLALQRSGQVALLLWYDWPVRYNDITNRNVIPPIALNGAVTGLYVDGAGGVSSCGGDSPGQVMQDYWTLDASG